MKKILTAIGIVVVGFLFFMVFGGSGREPDPTRRTAILVAAPPPISPLPVVNFADVPPAEPRLTPIQMVDHFIQYPLAISSDKGIFTLSLGGSTHGDFYHHDHEGRLITLYQHKGHGPGELGEPFSMSVIGDEIFISERRKLAVHVFDTRSRYLRRLHFSGVGEVVLANQKTIGLWTYRRHNQTNDAGHMLTLYDRETGKIIRELVPVDTTLYSLYLSGGAVWNEDHIFAVTANTGMIDIIDRATYQTTRIDPHDGLYVFPPPESWEEWSSKKTTGPRSSRVRAWQATFPIPVDIGIVGNRLVVLYAHGTAYFYNVHHLNGALISRYHRVAFPHPRLHGTRLEGIAVDDDDRQYYAHVDLVDQSDVKLSAENLSRTDRGIEPVRLP